MWYRRDQSDEHRGCWRCTPKSALIRQRELGLTVAPTQTCFLGRKVVGKGIFKPIVFHCSGHWGVCSPPWKCHWRRHLDLCLALPAFGVSITDTCETLLLCPSLDWGGFSTFYFTRGDWKSDRNRKLVWISGLKKKKCSRGSKSQHWAVPWIQIPPPSPGWSPASTDLAWKNWRQSSLQRQGGHNTQSLTPAIPVQYSCVLV